MKQRDFSIRVKLNQVEGAKEYWVGGEQGVRFENGDGSAAFESNGGVYRVSPAPNPALTSYYRIQLETLPLSSRQRARLHAQNWTEELGIPAEVIEDPPRRPWSLSSPSKDAILRVCVGKFATHGLAEQALSLMPDVEKAEIIVDDARPFPGFLRIADADNQTAGRMLADGLIQPREPDGTVGLAKADPDAESAPSPDDFDLSYRGRLQLFPQKDGPLLPVNIIDIETYLLSVTPAEIGDFAPDEALKAQAVAARSEAIHKLLAGSRHGDDRYDFVSTQLDQVYRGAGKEDSRATKAVRATEGEVLTYQGEVIDAVYSHSCGGVTANSEEVWPGQAVKYLRSRADDPDEDSPGSLATSIAVINWMGSDGSAWCDASQSDFPDYAREYFRWQRTYSGESLERCLAAYGYNVGTLRELRIAQRGESGRVIEIEVRGTGGVQRITNGDEIRSALNGLPSSLFTTAISMEGDHISAVTFRGAGYGHGVGMCQMGAFMMAQRGETYKEILRHYFSGVKIEKIY